MKTSIHLDEKFLDFIRTYPGKEMWLDIDTGCGTISLSRNDAEVFYKSQGHIIYVPDPPRSTPAS